jgi:ribosomal protein L44E
VDLRLGDVIDDFCVKCRRLTNHAIVSLMNGAAAKVRCRTCYSDHDYRNEQAPPSKRDLLKQKELFNAVLSGVAPAPAPEPESIETPAKKKKKSS